MAEEREEDPNERSQLSPADYRKRLIGRASEHDREDIAFWQSASEQLRGQTLYELLRLTEAIRAATPETREERRRLILRPGSREIQMRE